MERQNSNVIIAERHSVVLVENGNEQLMWPQCDVRHVGVGILCPKAFSAYSPTKASTRKYGNQ